MKFKKIFLIKYIYLITFTFIVMPSCSLFKKVRHNDSKINFDSNYFEPVNNNNTFNKKTEVQIKNLENINTIYFPLDKYHILSDFFSILDEHANFLRNNSFYHIRIEGHADERGTPEYNIALGERRAYSVKAYLQSKGVLSEQMETISYGKEKPACFGHTEAAYSKNRRVILSY